MSDTFARVRDPCRESDTYSSLTRLWLSVSMKLPRLRVLRVLFLRPKLDFLVLRLLSFLPTLPPMQKRMVAMKKQANAAQVKP